MPNFLKTRLPRMMKSSTGGSLVPEGAFYVSTDACGPSAPLGMILSPTLIPVSSWLATEATAFLSDTGLSSVSLASTRARLAAPPVAFFHMQGERKALRLCSGQGALYPSTGTLDIGSALALPGTGFSGASTRIATIMDMAPALQRAQLPLAVWNSVERDAQIAAMKRILSEYGWAEGYDLLSAAPLRFNASGLISPTGELQLPISGSYSPTFSLGGYTTEPQAVSRKVFRHGDGALLRSPNPWAVTSAGVVDNWASIIALLHPRLVALVVKEAWSEYIVFVRERTVDDMNVHGYGLHLAGPNDTSVPLEVRLWTERPAPAVLAASITLGTGDKPTGSFWGVQEVGKHISDIETDPVDPIVFVDGVESLPGTTWSRPYYVYGWMGRVDHKDVIFDDHVTETATDGRDHHHLMTKRENLILSGELLRDFLSQNATTLPDVKRDEALSLITSYDGVGYFHVGTFPTSIPADETVYALADWLPYPTDADFWMEEEYDVGQGLKPMSELMLALKRSFHYAIPIGPNKHQVALTASRAVDGTLVFSYAGYPIDYDEAELRIGEGCPITYLNGATQAQIASYYGASSLAELVKPAIADIAGVTAGKGMSWTQVYEMTDDDQVHRLGLHHTLTFGTYKLASLAVSFDFFSFRNFIGRKADKTTEAYFASRAGVPDA